MPANWPHCFNQQLTDPCLETKLSGLLADMSLAQKVGQMIQPDIRYITPAEVGEYQIGSVLSGGGAPPNNDHRSSAADWLALADEFYDAALQSGCVVPPAWGIDAVHGNNNLFGATLYPHNIGLGASRSPELVRQIASATAVEVQATGLDWTFAPTLAVVQDDRWGRSYEGFSECSDLVTHLTAPAVEGYQGEIGCNDFLRGRYVIATAKHFLADGGTDEGIDQGNTTCSEEDLLQIHGRPYAAAVAAGVQVVMASFSSWQGEKMHGHHYLLQKVLKDTMGFDGFIISDWNGHGQLTRLSNVAGDEAVNAGIDMLMAPEDWRELWHNTIKDVEDGLISEARINDAVTRILRVKLRAGLVFPNRPSTRSMAGKVELVGCEHHRELGRRAVRESAVLLKNKNNILPLARNQRILVTGRAADNVAIQAGGWSLTWQSDDVSNDDFVGATSIYEAIRQATGAANGQAELIAEPTPEDLKRFDAAIVVYGEKPYAEGYGDISHLSYSSLYPEDAGHLRRISEAGIPLVSVFLSGRPLWVNPQLNDSDAFVAAWLPGSEATGLADLLFSDGSCDFTGKLSFSWPVDPYQASFNRTDKNPLFPIGYGLSLQDKDLLPDDLNEQDPTNYSPDAEALLIFRRHALSPFTMFVGDDLNWNLPVFGRSFQSHNRTVSVQSADWQRQEDVRRVTWSGGSGQVYFRSSHPLDISHLIEAGALIELTLCVHKPATKPVILRLDSEHPESASIDITDRLKELGVEDWQTIRINIESMHRTGLDESGISTPFLLYTTGELELSFADIAIRKPQQ